ncbi:MAG: adenylyltransferase/cytidyltransferase family protein [Oscillospiraceae bacterium]|nr:adenylyltransferase/cytidyltransferase family protein [Oscillospiraceae bacterium]
MGFEAKKPYPVGLLMGVFDLFHVGHLRLIRRAKAECDFLRVGVLSDELVKKYKNTYPAIPQAERMEILSAIREVDEVVPIDDDPSRLLEWKRRPFDCFFSGDDYADNPYWQWEKEELRKLGADIVFFPYTKEQSSTKIKKKIGLGGTP